jgi:hypothetical protein
VKLLPGDRCQRVWLPDCGLVEVFSDAADKKRKKKSCFVVYKNVTGGSLYRIGRVHKIDFVVESCAIYLSLQDLPVEVMDGVDHVFSLHIDPFGPLQGNILLSSGEVHTRC